MIFKKIIQNLSFSFIFFFFEPCFTKINFMKNLRFLTAVLLGLFVFNSPNLVHGQASIPDTFYFNIEFCYCGEPVIKCRPDGMGSCETSSQIPCEEACEN